MFAFFSLLQVQSPPLASPQLCNRPHNMTSHSSLHQSPEQVFSYNLSYPFPHTPFPQLPITKAFPGIPPDIPAREAGRQSSFFLLLSSTNLQTYQIIAIMVADHLLQSPLHLCPISWDFEDPGVTHCQPPSCGHHSFPFPLQPTVTPVCQFTIYRNTHYPESKVATPGWVLNKASCTLHSLKNERRQQNQVNGILTQQRKDQTLEHRIIITQSQITRCQYKNTIKKQPGKYFSIRAKRSFQSRFRAIH